MMNADITHKTTTLINSIKQGIRQIRKYIITYYITISKPFDMSMPIVNIIRFDCTFIEYMLYPNKCSCFFVLSHLGTHFEPLRIGSFIQIVMFAMLKNRFYRTNLAVKISYHSDYSVYNYCHDKPINDMSFKSGYLVVYTKIYFLWITCVLSKGK